MLRSFLFLAGAALLIGAVRWWQPRVALRAAVLYAGLVALFFAAPLFTRAHQVPTDIAYQWRPYREMAPPLPKEIQPKNPLLSDTLLEQLPFHTLVRQRLRRFEAPLWAHELGTGQPFLGNAQAAPFAPLHLLALPLPPLRGLTVAAAWEVLLNLLLMHALALRLGAGPRGAALAAVATGFSTFAIAWAYDTPGMSAAWVPGVYLGLVLLRRDERGGFAGLVACALGLFLSGHPETAALTALVALPVVAALLAAQRQDRLRYLARLGGATLLTGCLAAPVLLPFLEALPASDRMEAALHWEKKPPRFDPRALLPVLDPLAFGSPRDGNWNGPENFNELCGVYGGLVPLALAVAGALALRGRVLALVAGGALALAAATRVPVLVHLLTALPALGTANFDRLRLFWVLAVALAAGLSFERLLASPGRRALTAGVLAAAGLALVCVPPPGGADWQRAWCLAAIGATFSTAVAILAFAIPSLRQRVAPVAIVAIAGLTLELFVLGIRYPPALSPDFDLTPPPALAFLAGQATPPGRPFRVLAEGGDLRPSLAALSGLGDPRGNDPMRPHAAARFVRRRLHAGQELRDPAAVDALGVRFALTGHRSHLPEPWRRVYDEQGGAVWENPNALPLFSIPRRFARVETPEDAIRIAMINPDFRALGVGLAAGSPAGESAQDGEVTAIRARSNGFDLEVHSLTAATVASSVSYARGWRATVDGAPAPVFEVNSAFVGFSVAPGSHRVRLDYAPRGWFWGWVLCGLGICAAARPSALYLSL